MKSKLIVLISFLILLLSPIRAFAHTPSIDPYGGGTEYISIDRKCPLGDLRFGNDQAKENAWLDFCPLVHLVIDDAINIHSKEECNRLQDKLRNRFQDAQTWPFDFPLEEKIAEAIKMCTESLDATTSILHPSLDVKVFDQYVIYITSLLGFIYLFLVLAFKNVRYWRLLILSVIFQALILLFVGFIGAVFQIGSKGPPIPALHNFLFFQQRYFLQIIITGAVTSFVIFTVVSLLLLIFKRELSSHDRKKIALFYTLVFNPFFFPVGIIFGLMHLIFLKKQSYLLK